jgi:hypothetical protein
VDITIAAAAVGGGSSWTASRCLPCNPFRNSMTLVFGVMLVDQHDTTDAHFGANHLNDCCHQSFMSGSNRSCQVSSQADSDWLDGIICLFGISSISHFSILPCSSGVQKNFISIWCTNC